MNRSWYRINAKDGKEAEVFIYDEIGFFGIRAEQFVKDLSAIQAETINLRVNTPGGNVFEGLAIYNALLAHKAKVNTHIDGLAASIGSVIALVGDEVNIAENAFFMIHNPYALVVGEARDMRKMAETLDKMRDSLVKTYAGKTGKGEDEIKTLMDEETWFTAEEAKAAGFVDKVTGKKAEKARFDLSVYNKVPQELIGIADELPSERDIEKTLREAGGLSRAAAKAVLSKGYKGLAQRDAEAADQRDADENTNLTEEAQMNIQELKAKHPDIFDAVRKEGFDAGKTEGASAVNAARDEGAKAERTRIQGVFSLMRPGREKIVNELAFDGKSTKADASVAILDAEDAKRAEYKNNLKADARDITVPPAEPGDALAQVDPNLPLEDRAKAEWDKSADIRGEFRDNFKAFVAYKKAAEAGQARIHNGNKGGK